MTGDFETLELFKTKLSLLSCEPEDFHYIFTIPFRLINLGLLSL
jgi:hypothetical protein